MLLSRSRAVPAFITFLSVLVFASVACVVQAQSATASLTGAVVDEYGGAIADALVILTDSATGLRRDARTNGEGTFVLTLLPPSTYHVRVERANFAPSELSDVVLNVARTSRDHLTNGPVL